MRSEYLESETKSLIDGLPVCHSTGAGFSTNQSYTEGGNRHEVHKSYDRSVYCQQVDNQTCLYAIFTGQNGCKVADFAIQKISAEILFGQLNGCTSEEVKDVLRQAFVTVEKDYLESIDSLLAQKAKLQCEIPDDMSHFEISWKYKKILEQLIDINCLLSIGSSAVLALIYNSKLYICNIGNCRALLCKTDENNVLRVIQLSVDHNISNEDERKRICDLGLDPQALKQEHFQSTRCIGCYIGKTGYKDSSYLSGASAEPVISLPEIVGPIAIDNSCRFLVLMSGGLCKTMRDIYSNESNVVNREIIQFIVEQFRTQSTLSGVAQSAVHNIVRMHHDTHIRQADEAAFASREDITLLVRNFNFPMPNAINTQRNRNNVTFNPVVQEHINGFSSKSDNNSIIDTSNSCYTSTNSSASGSDRRETFDKNLRIPSYVDFADYYRNVELAKATGTLPDFIDFD